MYGCAFAVAVGKVHASRVRGSNMGSGSGSGRGRYRNSCDSK